ncbi:MAG TPA: hypothetical protein PKL46_14120, partial [Aquabacterium sp.]|nr:hypothetical protein [Aquabacterium sp.]
MPQLNCLKTTRLRRTATAAACLLAMVATWPAAADSSITVGSNNWLGARAGQVGSNTDWFNAANWWAGPLFGLPDPIFPVYIGPSQWIVNGIPTDTFDLPASEAVLGGSFAMSSLEMRAWDGISQLRLTSGGLLTTSANIGGVNSAYQATGAIRPATLVLDGGSVVGSVNFLANSRLEVTRQYGALNTSFSGTLGELVLTSSASLALQSNSLSIDRVSNAGALTLAGGRNISVTGQFDNNGVFTLAGSGSTGTAAMYVTGNTTLSGNGSTVLTDANRSYIGGPAALTVAAGHTLRGAGYVTTSLVNQGQVIADGVLTVNAGSNSSIDNRAGTIQVADSGTLALSAGMLRGGALQGLGTGSRLAGNGSFEQVALSGDLLLTGGTTLRNATSSANLRVNSGSSVSLAGTLANTGTFTVLGNGTNGSASVYVLADTTLSGNGSTVLTDAN